MVGRDLLVLDEEACWAAVARHRTGRLAFWDGDGIDVLPVNYRVVELAGRRVAVVRTRPGSAIDRVRGAASLQVDSHDADWRTGWSVLVRGDLRPLDDGEVAALGPMSGTSWLGASASRVLALEPRSMTGRELALGSDVWSEDDDRRASRGHQTGVPVIPEPLGPGGEPGAVPG